MTTADVASDREIERCQEEKDNLIRRAILEGHYAKHQLSSGRHPLRGQSSRDQQNRKCQPGSYYRTKPRVVLGLSGCSARGVVRSKPRLDYNFTRLKCSAPMMAVRC